VIPGAIDSGLFDVMLMIYNSIQYPERSDLITRAREAGIGVMAMKTMAGRQQDRVAGLVNDKTTFSQAAIKWALSDPSVDSVLISIRTFEHVDEYCRASGQTLTSADKAVLGKYETAVNNQFCRIGCTTCQASCPEQVAVGDIMRFGMYYENYGNEKQAILEYAALNGRHKARACLSCTSGACETACPHNLSIRDRLVRYDGMLRV
jgi:predicted aldo/keto reductase-like oxidoreductase